ncbi:MAG: ABC transporter ATP-binding protein [Defluviitaleaceae bacterium]|nr:ABC transporter ATP-binding protein [Defluviitaleaceae bacterium]
MIEVRNLTKQYGQRKAIDNLNFSIKAGEIVGFLGPNGAGKTTTMNIMTGFIAATSGEVTIDGIDIVAEPERAKANIGYLPDTPPVYLDMRVEEYLNFAADIKGVKRSQRKDMVKYVMSQVSIDDIPRRLIKNLSRGYRQRVGLAQAMLGNPKVIIMDEPTIGLDPKQIIEMRDVVKNLGKKHTVILSSHIMQEVSAVCDRMMIINRGKIVATGTPESLSETITKGAAKLQVRVKGDLGHVQNALAEYPVIKCDAATAGGEPGTVDLLLAGSDGQDVREPIFRCMAKNNLPILLMKSTELSLEEIFLSLTDSDRMGISAMADFNAGEASADVPAAPKETELEPTPGEAPAVVPTAPKEAEQGFIPGEAAGTLEAALPTGTASHSNQESEVSDDDSHL